MIKRVGKNLTVLTAEVPAESVQLERDGYAVIRDVLTDGKAAEPWAAFDRDWSVAVMRHAVALNGSFFNTERMVSEYARQAYRLALEQ